MAALRLRGQSLSVLISALYLTEGGADTALELSRVDVLERQILLQGSDHLSSLMWKAVGPLLTSEWDAFRVVSGGSAQRSPGRVVLLDSTQALLELQGRRSVRITEASDWPSQNTVWLPELEDRRLEAKIVAAEFLPDLREPIVVEVETDGPPASYAQYIPLGGGNTMFVRYRLPRSPHVDRPLDLANGILDRLAKLEEILLTKM